MPVTDPVTWALQCLQGTLKFLGVSPGNFVPKCDNILDGSDIVNHIDIIDCSSERKMWSVTAVPWQNLI